MRIVQVTVYYPPNVIAGGTLVPQRIAEELASRGHEVTVYSGELDTNSTPYRVRIDIENGIEVTRINQGVALPEQLRDNYENPVVSGHFADYLAHKKPEVVHFHCIQGLGAALIPVAKASGAKVFVTPHDQWWWCAKQFLVDSDHKPCGDIPALGVCACASNRVEMDERNSRVASYLRNADRVFAVSQAMSDQLLANGVDPRQVYLNENAAPLSKSGSRRSVESKAPVRFLFTGGSGLIKGGSVVAKAVAAIADPDGWTLTMSGFSWTENGDIDPQTGQILENHPNVRLIRPYASDKSGEVMAEHDVLIMASLAFESSSLVVREALAAGCCVLTGENPGPCEVVSDGVNGLVIPRGDAAALADAMRRLVADRDLLAQLQAGSIESRVSERSVSQQVNELLTHYQVDMARPIQRVRTVLALAGGPEATNRYRVENVSEALKLAGVHLDLFHYRDIKAKDRTVNSDAYLLHRVPATNQILDWIAKIRSDNPEALILYDIDDLVIDPQFREDLDPVLASVGVDVDLYWQGVLRYRTTLEACDLVVASTESLAQELRAITGKQVAVYRNGVSTELARISAQFTGVERTGRLRLGYFAGSITHQPDWDFIATVVAEVLVKYDAELLLLGEVSPGSVFDGLADRVTTHPAVPWRELPALIASVDVNLAPLVGNRFNDCKSAIKYQEAALAKVVTIASATQPFVESIENGVSGFTCGTLTDWSVALAALLESPKLRRKMGVAARRMVLSSLGPGPQGWRYREILETGLTDPAHSDWSPVMVDEPWIDFDQMAALSPTAAGPVTNPVSLGSLFGRVVNKLHRDGVTGLVRALGRRFGYFRNR